MPVELRKRKAPVAPEPLPVAKRASRATKKDNQAPAAEKKAASPKAPVPSVGDVISLDVFGGEVQTQDEETVTLKALLAQSKMGVVLFTYPRASTPGCTRQACLFRDSYQKLSNAGLGVYGLSSDSPKANTTFKTKQKLPYRLLCDPSFTLIEAIGLKKQPKGTQRGVFLVDKSGKVLIAQAGGPADTLDVVVELIDNGGLGSETLEEKLEPETVPAVEEKEEKAEEKEEKVEEKNEDKSVETEAKAEDKIKEKVEEKSDDKTDEKPEDKTEEKTEEKPEDKTEEKTEEKEEGKTEAQEKPEQSTDKPAVE
ncbi:hypothetical protein TD95_001048 [Thielaviopsis punctulata]|uniref:thioredoxin-dependent peroxiredoxin n=1 Tax=Thielaviopsis punctulata TaxID=72032 RepID=A0A0F4Z8W4_9PEZI|nr:hypothetical protein TD95_001048 [Thielaviopsis punctulata]